MTKFSERQGIEIVSKALQTDGMTDELRNSLWNVLYLSIWDHARFKNPGIYKDIDYLVYIKLFFINFLKHPVDRAPDRLQNVQLFIRNQYFGFAWNRVYDFIEFTIQLYPSISKNLHQDLNGVLRHELSGYHLISGQFVPVTDPNEVTAMQEVLDDSRFSGVQTHFRTAISHLSNKENPDYRNCIKESISAVESMARVITENKKAVLSDALKLLEKEKKLHPALKEGFIKLYGYASDEGGIRHAMLDEPNISQADAKFFLLSCTSFVNYLKSLL